MSGNYNRVVSLIASSDELGTRAGVRQLQTALADAGFTENSSSYAYPYGVIGI